MAIACLLSALLDRFGVASHGQGRAAVDVQVVHCDLAGLGGRIEAIGGRLREAPMASIV